jgi:hypothetical protein
VSFSVFMDGIQRFEKKDTRNQPHFNSERFVGVKGISQSSRADALVPSLRSYGEVVDTLGGGA